jgi:hypothetical protein
MENVGAGAIGLIVIHNPEDTNNDFLIQVPDDLPGGSFTGPHRSRRPSPRGRKRSGACSTVRPSGLSE